MTERDRALLAFAAEQRILLPAHVRVLLGVSAESARARCGALERAGLLKRPEAKPYALPAGYQISRRGLTAIGATGRAPAANLSAPDHDIGVAWLWLAARRGAFGPLREVISERRLRSHDADPERAGEPLGVRLGGYGPGGRERLHYPDLVLVDRDGHRIAIELELSRKGIARRETILSGYAADRRISAVLYLVEIPAIGRAISASARRLGISHLVHVQRARLAPVRGAPAHGAESVRRGSRAEQREALR